MATFCNKVTNGEKPEIHVDGAISLIYIAELVKEILNDLGYNEMKPFYKGFKGNIIKEKDFYITKGKYKIEDDKIIITELPIGSRALQSTHDFKEYIEMMSQKENPFILDCPGIQPSFIP